MVTVKNGDPLRILGQIVGHCFADDEEGLKWRHFVVFPLEAQDIEKHFFINFSPTDVDHDVFILMIGLKKLSDRID